MKFGGTSVADAERLKRAARRIVRAREQGHNVVAVLSARGSMTDELVAMAEEVSPTPDPREMDILLSTGERMSCALCAIYTDVAGVFSADPRIVPDARKLPVVSFEEMLEMAASGARVLQLRSVEYG